MMRSRRPAVESLEGRQLLSADVVATLSTSRPAYAAGQPVVIRLTETNRSDHPVQVEVGPSLDGVRVDQGHRVVWSSDSGVVPLYLISRTLAPGQSFTVSSTWHDAAETGVGHPTGRFVAVGPSSLGSPSASFRVVPGNR